MTAAIKLGTSADCYKSGRVARLSGTFWRHRKTEQCGDAALGLLMRILSFCADQAVSLVSHQRMRELFRGSHGRRALNELLAAGFLEDTPEGYEVHDWYDHNRVRKPELTVIPGGGTPKASMAADGESTASLRRVYGEAMAKPGPEIVEETPVPRARAETQDPGPRELLKKEEHRGAESPPLREQCSGELFPELNVTATRPIPPTEPPAPPPESAEEGPRTPRAPRERIAELEARYGAPETLREARESCSLSRRNGQMTDAVWARTLTRLAAYPVHVVLHAMQKFNERYADGNKDEAYLCGMARNMAMRGVHKVTHRHRDEENQPTEEEIARSMAALENLMPLEVAS